MESTARMTTRLRAPRLEDQSTSCTSPTQRRRLSTRITSGAPISDAEVPGE